MTAAANNPRSWLYGRIKPPTAFDGVQVGVPVLISPSPDETSLDLHPKASLIP